MRPKSPISTPNRDAWRASPSLLYGSPPSPRVPKNLPFLPLSLKWNGLRRVSKLWLDIDTAHNFQLKLSTSFTLKLRVLFSLQVVHRETQTPSWCVEVFAWIRPEHQFRCIESADIFCCVSTSYTKSFGRHFGFGKDVNEWTHLAKSTKMWP